MINNKQIEFASYQQSTHPVSLNPTQRLLVNATCLFKPNTTACKLDYFEKMLNYLRAIGLYVLSNNRDIELKNPGIQKMAATDYKDRVSTSLTEFLIHFGILSFSGNEMQITKDYSSLLEHDRISKLIRNEGDSSNKSLSSKEKRLVRDFRFVRDLVQKYNHPGYSFQTITGKESEIWASLITERKLDYEVRLCETLYHLVDLKIPQKIESPFEEAYYTESGQNAFQNFTQFRFLDYLRNITKGSNSINVFDLGCGYGNYVEVVQQNFPEAFITGIEKNPKVFSETSDKFAKAENVEIINDDFFQYETGKKYDVVLMNYVLFYFNFTDKKKIIDKAKSMLAEGGSIVLCQYYSGIESLKRELAKSQNDDSTAKKIEMYYSDKILYANTLWNDAVDTFAEAVKWNEFKTIVSEADLYMASMTNADPFYYSLFVELKHQS
ncbi:class I SAM-dependent methyltransferase [uncultured Draconibacterium sp.]|uniref:class I SAM-dependent methyltransferase n=1 Tax=uncultured Draconibacterium sp. TaxID=1573823 RepID=UPI0029C88A59|nr:class I SAM-dependent methyltransferase [uncultured Draconibacterium sp.]